MATFDEIGNQDNFKEESNEERDNPLYGLDEASLMNHNLDEENPIYEAASDVEDNMYCEF